MKACSKIFSLLALFAVATFAFGIQCRAAAFWASDQAGRGAQVQAMLGLGSGSAAGQLGQAEQGAQAGAEKQAGQSEQELRRDVQFLSSSLCSGRATGSRGSVEAGGYILRRLSGLGYHTFVQGFKVDSARVGHNILAGTLAEEFAASAAKGSPSGKASRAAKAKGLIVIIAYYDGLGVLGGSMYPGADSNASGVAALLAIAERLKGRSDVLLAFVDAHNVNLSGATALKTALKGRRISLVVNLDILGSTLAPVDKYWPNFIIALGADGHRALLEECNAGIGLHYYHTYYRSRSFTELFYKRAGDQKVFVADGYPTILFTSGITSNTNKPTDTFDTLDYEIFAKRVEFISRFLERYRRN